MAATKFHSRKLIPANPGYQLVYLANEDGVWEALDPVSIIAWGIETHIEPNNPEVYQTFTQPITVDDYLDSMVALIIEPSGRVIKQHDREFASVEEAVEYFNNLKN